MQKTKLLSEEALQIAVKRREDKSKGAKERYTHLNAEFQRIARRDKKAFLSNQSKEIEENNRMGLEEEMATHFSILAWRIPMGRGAWWVTVHGVAESTQLSD